MIDLRESGAVGSLEPVLTIGPRWTGEIDYFRERIGLKGTIGLDLFSPDDELIKVGDMHEMPFEDETFGLVYQRNTFDKSYDIRAALRECVRVLRDGGVLITDDCYAYTDGVSELSRTSIKHNDQVLRVLGDHVGEVLHDRETDSDEDMDRARRAARRPDPKVGGKMPPPSKIPDYDPRFFRPCIFPMLRRLGYGTRVTINNGVGSDQPVGDRVHDLAQRLRPVREAPRDSPADHAAPAGRDREARSSCTPR